MSADSTQGSSEDLSGTSIEVWVGFEGTWVRGFEIADVLQRVDGTPSYRVRRVSDGRVLPTLFRAEDISLDGHRP